MSDFCIKLNLPVPLVNNKFDCTKYTARQLLLDSNDISDEYLAWLDVLGLRLLRADVFYSVPNVPYVVHQDHFKLTDFPKINFVFGGAGSKMNWYNIKPEMLGKITEPDSFNPYMTFKDEEVNLVHSQELVGTYMVQAGIPHNVTNITEPRVCISTVHAFKNKTFMTWNQSKSIFSPFIL